MSATETPTTPTPTASDLARQAAAGIHSHSCPKCGRTWECPDKFDDCEFRESVRCKEHGGEAPGSPEPPPVALEKKEKPAPPDSEEGG